VVSRVLLAVAAIALAGVLTTIVAFSVRAQQSDDALVVAPVVPATTAPEPVTPVPSPPAPVRVTTSIDGAWLDRESAATGIPRRALQAYASAALAVQSTAPACHLAWNTLAAVGAVESDHGRIAGGVIGEDGRTTVPVLGPPLDGIRYDFVGDTDGGRWDGDATGDRAVGPMQLLPSMWETFIVDGDGDGRADPQDLDDEALASARYLCGAGMDLATAEGWTAAIRSYNDVDSYVDAVRTTATTYAVTAR
jgi:membrane-bound lytic murein transglycosylase B